MFRQIFRDCSFSAVVAGFVAVLVGFTSSVALIFNAAGSLSATQEQTASWLLALGAGMAVASVALSLAYKLPILIAWSTPGAALIAAAAADGQLGLALATGSFLTCALMIALIGFSGGFAKTIHHLPLPLASALLAGVLARFALDAFAAIPSNPALMLSMLAAFLVGRSFWPKATIPILLLLGIGISMFQGRFHGESIPLHLTAPVWVTPEFSLTAFVGVTLPLFIVTMASQNLPGIAVFHANGYSPPVSKIIGWSGVANLAVAPFGGFTLNVAAITAAFCVGPESHTDPKRRYISTIAAGIFYGTIGIFGATVVGLLAAFPRELILAVAGFALIGTIGTGLAAATSDVRYRPASVIVFLVVLSGVSLLGIGSAFWGIVAGSLVLLISKLQAPMNRY